MLLLFQNVFGRPDERVVATETCILVRLLAQFGHVELGHGILRAAMLVDGEGRTHKERRVCFFLSSFLHMLMCARVPLFLTVTNIDFEKHWSLVNSQCLLSTTGK